MASLHQKRNSTITLQRASTERPRMATNLTESGEQIFDKSLGQSKVDLNIPLFEKRRNSFVSINNDLDRLDCMITPDDVKASEGKDSVIRHQLNE